MESLGNEEQITDGQSVEGEQNPEQITDGHSVEGERNLVQVSDEGNLTSTILMKKCLLIFSF